MVAKGNKYFNNSETQGLLGGNEATNAIYE